MAHGVMRYTRRRLFGYGKRTVEIALSELVDATVHERW